MPKPIPRLLPSQHEADRLQREKEQELQEEARQRREHELRQAVDVALKSEWGRILWAWIFNACGYNKPSLTRFAGGDVAQLSTECKDAQRQIYLELRKLATPELLMRAEYQAEFGEAPSTASDAKTKKGEVKNA